MLSDEELVAICNAEISDIDSESDLSQQRTRSMDYYMGDMDEYIPSGEGRSEVVTRDAFDTVESVLPSMLKIFVDAENAVEFQPVTEGDEDQAKLETKVIRDIFYEQNDGFLLLYSFIKDAFQLKTGIWKSWFEEGEWKREEYTNLTDVEYQKILMSTQEYEVIDEGMEDGGINLVLKVKCPNKIRIECVAPEEFGISRNANDPDPKKATFTYQKTEKTVSELIEAGFDPDKVKAIPTDDNWDEVRLARRNLSDEQDYSSAVNESMRKVWVTECYLKVDMDGDDVAEIVKVTLGSMGSGNHLLDWEEVDEIPFVAATPIILTHKFYGMSLIDMVEDIQEIRTVLFRGILDNTYLQNNLRTAINEKVNIDDLLISRPGGVVRTEGVDPPGNHIMPIIHPQLPQQSFGLLEVLDDMIKNRTGVGDEVAGLDSEALTNVNTGALLKAYDAAHMRVELMARIFAELGVKSLFKDIHRLMHKNQTVPMEMKLDGIWQTINPTHWREGRRARVTIGLGNQSKEKMLLATQDILMMQEKALSSGYVTPDKIFNAVSDRIEAFGLNVNRYFQNPQSFQPPEQPNPMLELEKAKLQLEQQKMQLESQKVQAESQVKMMLAESRERESAIKMQMEQMRGQFQMQKVAVDEQNQIMRANTDQFRARYEMEMGARQQEWKETNDALQLKLQKQQQELDEYKAQLQSATQLETKLMDIEQRMTEMFVPKVVEDESDES